MSNYTQTTDFAVKDTYATGVAAKLIKGSEFEAEFNAISVAVATKADILNPTFSADVTVTGTLTAGTIEGGLY